MPTPVALIVEDSREFAVMASRLVGDEGFDPVVTEDGEEAVELARRHHPELVLLDISLPGIDGLEVCRRIRTFSDCYVVMVTSRDEEFDRVLGLTVGADDYVTKPYSARELAARVRAMRRRPRAAAADSVRTFGALRIDTDSRETWLDGDLVPLTRIEFDLLEMLSGSPRRAFERGQLLDAVWGTSGVGDDHVIEVHLGNLRRKLGESAGEQRYIRTVRGVGYRFEPAP